MKGARRQTYRPWRRFFTSNDGSTVLEFALVSLPFLVLVLGTFEVAFDLYSKAVLDISLVQAVRKIQTGNAQNAANGASFITNYLCTGIGVLLQCSNVFVQVQRIQPNSSQDFYDYTTGSPPVSGGVLNLSSYASNKFCNGGPSQLLLINAVYVGPLIVGQLIPNAFGVLYKGGLVHATFSSVGTVTEGYAPAAAAAKAAPEC